MRISDFALRKVKDRIRTSARVVWEDSERGESEIFFETEDGGPGAPACNPHAFLLACAAPALRYGEQRVYLDAEVCPVLKDGLVTAMSILHDWYYRGRRAPLIIEAKAVLPGLRAPAEDRAAAFFSGGIDAYATLRLNRLSFPLVHPHSIKDGILVFGLEQDDPEKFEHVKEHLTGAAEACGVSLIPVYTNIYLVYRSEDARNRFHFWEFEFEGSALAAIAHSLSWHLSIVSVSSTLSSRTLTPYGSHPLLDPHYSSSDMTISHRGVALSRLDKTRLVAEWGAPLPYLRVCNQYAKYEQGALNCGECEKCIRTKLAFLVLDKLHEVTVFSNADITADLVERRVRVTTDYKHACYEELLAPLSGRGHTRIARVLTRKLAEYRGNGATRPSAMAGIHRRVLHRLSRVF